MRLLLVSFITVLATMTFTSCDQQIQKQPLPKFTEVYKDGIESRRTLKIEIEGMMCEVGCASKIKKELLEQDAVSSVIIDFVKERETDFAIVEFDPKGNTIEYIYGVVNAIADGKLYNVKSVETTYYKENHPE